nr:aminotransferase class I/II-fold pyridoxal phosphate-dependent enzyme [Halothiobacillus sp.]
IWTEQGYAVDWADFESKLGQARIFVLCAPHNPVGRVWRRDELQRMADLCVQHDVLMIVDEIHADLVYSPHRHIPMACLSPEIGARCITLHAPSKTFNVAGLNTSFAVVENADLRQRLKDALNRSGLTSGNVFGITALTAAYEAGAPWLEQLLKQLQANIVYVVDYIEQHIPSIRVQRPESTFLLWLDCRALGLDDAMLNRFFIDEAGLGLNTGISFGVPGSGFMRLNIACPLSQLETAMTKLQVAIERLDAR